ncbi:RDD family protein [Actinoplanes sp. NPDC051470]|uniref:RDD family protein n=1 Tax=unclassified Actinoplanes TaxID=2626549 RepID=UPI00341CD913
MAARTNSSPPAFDPGSTLLAGFGRRFAALMIDWALCLLVGSLVGDPRGVAWPPVVALVLLNTFFIGLFGQTPGMALAGIRCVSIEDGGAIGLAKGLLRAVLLALLVPAVIMDQSRRGWHDRLAGSVVILRPRT